MTTRLLALLVALCTVACNTAPVEVYAAPGLVEPTLVAIEAWNEALAEHCPDHPGLALVERREDASVTVAWGWHPQLPDSEGAYDTRTDQIVLKPELKRYSSGLREHVIAHELGHALGAEHSSGHDGVMMPVADVSVDTAHVSREDARQVCRDTVPGAL